MRRAVRRSPCTAAGPADRRGPGREHLTAQRAAHQVHRTRRADQPAALSAVGRQHRLQAMPRKLGAELGPDCSVALACTLDAGGQVMPGQFRERHRVPPQHPVHPVVRRNHVQQPRHRGLLETIAARRVNPDRPSVWKVMHHEASIEGIEHTFHSNTDRPAGAERGAGLGWAGRAVPPLCCIYGR